MGSPSNSRDELNSPIPRRNVKVSGSATEQPTSWAPKATVSIVIPMRNEAEHIRSCLRSLVEQTFPSGQYEILVADGRSTDSSREAVALFQGSNVLVRLLDNPYQKTPSGMNLGIRAANGQIIIIAGAHTIYPVDFVENCVLWLNKTGADVVGGPVRTEVHSNHFGAKLASLILSSPFGVGNSRFRTSLEEGYVDTVPFGAYRRAIFDRVGLFNVKLVRNQDNDLSVRVRRAGGKIYMTPALTTTYIPVRSFTDLLRQAFSKSQWHIFTLRENVHALGFRHVCPAVFAIVVAGLLVFSIWSSLARLFLAILILSYFSLGFTVACRHESHSSPLLKTVMPFACFLFHVAYGLGTIVGLRHLFTSASVRSATPFDSREISQVADVLSTGRGGE